MEERFALSLGNNVDDVMFEPLLIMPLELLLGLTCICGAYSHAQQGSDQECHRPCTRVHKNGRATAILRMHAHFSPLERRPARAFNQFPKINYMTRIPLQEVSSRIEPALTLMPEAIGQGAGALAGDIDELWVGGNLI